MEDLFAGLVIQYPKLAGLLIGIGTFRLFFKPIFSALEKAVADSASKRDDLILENVKKHRVFKSFVWVLDFLFSVKVPIRTNLK